MTSATSKPKIMTSNTKILVQSHDSASRLFFIDTECGGEFGCGANFYNDYYATMKKRHWHVDKDTRALNPWISRYDMNKPSGRAQASRNPLFIPFTFIKDKPEVNRAVYTVLYRWESLGAEARARLYKIGCADVLPMEEFLAGLPEVMREAVEVTFGDNTVRMIISFPLHALMALILSVRGLPFMFKHPQNYAEDVECTYAADFMGETDRITAAAKSKGRKEEFMGIGTDLWKEYRQIPFGVLTHILLGINRGIMYDALNLPKTNVLYQRSLTVPIFFSFPPDLVCASSSSRGRATELRSNHHELDRLALIAFAEQPGSGGPDAFASTIGMPGAKITVMLDHPALLCVAKGAYSGNTQDLVVSRIRYCMEKLTRPNLHAPVLQLVLNVYKKLLPRLGDTLAKDGSDAATWIILETIYASNITTCPWFDRSPQCLLDTDIVSVTWCHSQIRILDELFKQLEALVEKHQTETREALLEELLNDPTLNGEAAAAAAAAAAGPAKKKARQTRYSRVIDTPSVLSRRGATPPRVCRDALPKKRLRGIKYRAPRFTFFEMPLDTPRYMKMIGRAPDLPSWTPFGGNVINMLSF